MDARAQIRKEAENIKRLLHYILQKLDAESDDGTRRVSWGITTRSTSGDHGPHNIYYVFGSDELASLHRTAAIALITELRGVPIEAYSSDTPLPLLFFAYFPRPRMHLPKNQLDRLEAWSKKTEVILVALRPSGNPTIPLAPLHPEEFAGRSFCSAIFDIQIDHITKQVHRTEHNMRQIEKLKLMV